MEHLLKKVQRENDSHKGENGKIAVIGGSRDYSGAPALSAKAALRAGSDLVKITTSEQVRTVVAGFSENFMVDAYPSGYLEMSGIEKVLQTVRWSDVTVLGPGLSNPDPEVIQETVSKVSKPLVIDAEAIKPSLNAELSEAVLTPHQAEAEAIREKYGDIESFVEQEDAVVVLKGENDRIYTRHGIDEIDVGHPTMTVGGTGDLLTGLISSLIGQGLEKEDAAKLGTWINGKAGEKAAEKYGNGALATDIVEEISEVLQ